MIEEIKNKIFEKVSEKLNGDVSISDLEILHKIVHTESSDPVKFYNEMMSVFREKMEKTNFEQDKVCALERENV